MVDGIIVDSNGRAKARSAIGAARKHHIGAVARAVRFHTGQHVNIVIRWAAGTVQGHKDLTTKANAVDAALDEAAAQVHRRGLVKRGGLPTILRIARARAPKTAAGAADKQVTIASHIERSRLHRVGKANGSLPGDPAVGRPTKCSAVTCEKTGPKLILESMPRAAGEIDREPFFVASVRAAVRRSFRPGLPAVD